MADIRSIKEKLANLLAKARDSGSTEAEVNTCLAKAQKLMEQYGVTEADLVNGTAGSFRKFEIHMPEGRTAHCPVVRYVGATIGKFCGVTLWTNHYVKGSPIEGIGFEVDVEYALWLLRALRIFMDDQWAEYRDWQLKACTRQELKEERIGFIRGFCTIVTARINSQIKEGAQGGMAAGTSLIVQKSNLIEKELEARGVKLESGRSMAGCGRGAETGAASGALAGQSAPLGRGAGKSAIAIGSA